MLRAKSDFADDPRPERAFQPAFFLVIQPAQVLPFPTRAFVTNPIQHLLNFELGGEGSLAGEQGEQDQPQRVEVGAIVEIVDRLPVLTARWQPLFRGHGCRSAGKRNRPLVPWWFERAKISQLQALTVVPDQHVAEFEIAVDQLMFVDGRQTSEDLLRPVQHLARGKRLWRLF